MSNLTSIPGQATLALGDAVLETVEANADVFLDTFASWLALNRHVWLAFEREADKVWARGRRHYSARTIVASAQALRRLPADVVPGWHRQARVGNFRQPEASSELPLFACGVSMTPTVAVLFARADSLAWCAA